MISKAPRSFILSFVFQQDTGVLFTFEQELYRQIGWQFGSTGRSY